MSDITVRVNDLPAMPNPGICASTGEPTTETVTLRTVRYPEWTWAGLLFGGLLGVLVLRMFSGSRTATVTLPQVRRIWVRRRNARLAFFVVLPCAVVFGLGGISVDAPLIALLAVLPVIPVTVVYYRSQTVKLSWDGSDRITLKGLHPAFVAALHQTPAQPAAVPPGWHPDPSGQHAWRWFDGTQWTEHVSGAPHPA